MKQRNSEIQILDALKENGYSHNMIISDGRLHVDKIDGPGFKPENCIVEEEHRFEGMTNPSDMSIIYGVKAPDGSKGAVVVSYAPHASPDAADFFRLTQYAVKS